LEKIIEPFLVTHQASRVFFRGLWRSLEVPVDAPRQIKTLVYHVTCALSCLHNLGEAISANDMVDAINSTYSFARMDLNIEICRKYGCGAEDLAGAWGLDPVSKPS
jgi:hypothetical protein